MVIPPIIQSTPMKASSVTCEFNAISRNESELIVKFRISSLILWSGLSTLCELHRR